MKGSGIINEDNILIKHIPAGKIPGGAAQLQEARYWKKMMMMPMTVVQLVLMMMMLLMKRC